MKANHRERILEALKFAKKCDRAVFAQRPDLYGLDFTRRIRELRETHNIKLEYDEKHEYIKAWIYVGEKTTMQLELM